jgi:RNA polymerase sigma factor (TIGR02999 family)
VSAEPGSEAPTPTPPTPPGTAAQWFEQLYHELRRRARGELFRHQALTLGATTLLHEAWLRLQPSALNFATQQDLVRYAGRVMRGIVIDHIRARASLKRGGHLELLHFETLSELQAMQDHETLQLDAALEELAVHEPQLAELVELKFFAGLSFIEIAALRGVSDRTVQREWDKARLLLFTAIRS